MLRKGAYPYKYMDDWKDFEIKNVGEHYDFYVESNTLLLADVFENFAICNVTLSIDMQKLI